MKEANVSFVKSDESLDLSLEIMMAFVRNPVKLYVDCFLRKYREFFKVICSQCNFGAITNCFEDIRAINYQCWHA